MDKGKIIEFLKKSPGIVDIEEIEYKPEFLVLRFFYEYDDDEIEAAKNYANEQCENDSEDIWYDEYYIPYIVDLAVDEINDTFEELVEQMDVDVQFINYEPDRDDVASEVIAVFTDLGREFNIDDILDSLDM